MGLFLTLGHSTNSKRVPGVSLGTYTVDVMLGNLTQGIKAAESGTRIGTLLFNARLVARTFAVHKTFRSTVRR